MFLLAVFGIVCVNFAMKMQPFSTGLTGENLLFFRPDFLDAYYSKYRHNY